MVTIEAMGVASTIEIAIAYITAVKVSRRYWNANIRVTRVTARTYRR
jgi:hypothetical protein